MKLMELPKYVYKYISWKNDDHKKIVLENKIFFSSVKKFNDPFDSTIALSYDKGTDEQIYNLFVQIIHRNNPTLTDDEVRKIAGNELRNNDFRNDKRIQHTIDNQREIIATKYGIFSTSRNCDNILMWSHYSDSHKGICVRFNCDKLKDYIENVCPKNDWIIVWYDAEYSKVYPILNPFELSDEYQIIKSLTIKSDIWVYEDEIRFILFTYPNKELTLPEGIIDQIVLGCKIGEDDRNQLIDFSRNKNIELVQAFRKENDFVLGFIQVRL